MLTPSNLLVTSSHLLVTSAAALAGELRTFRMKPGVSMMVRFGQWRYLSTVVTENASGNLHTRRLHLVGHYCAHCHVNNRCCAQVLARTACHVTSFQFTPSTHTPHEQYTSLAQSLML
jgi:hypothetical protein